jgi:1-deoxy-D-xylulose-5-phosphate synthase
VFDIAYLRALPNLVLCAPKDEAELRDLLYSSVHDHDKPWAIRYPRGEGPGADFSGPAQLIKPGTAEVVHRTGPRSDVLLIGLGNTVNTCLLAAADLAIRGVGCTVVNARFVKPLDTKLLGELIAAHPLVAAVEDHVLLGGFGSAILEFMSDACLTGASRLLRFGIEDRFIEHGQPQELQRMCGIDPQSIAARIYDAATPQQLSAINA